MKVNLLIFLVLTFTVVNICKGQTDNFDNSDSKLWNGLNVKYKVNKKWKLNFEQQIRSELNVLKYQKSVSRLGVKYELNKFWNLKMLSRFEHIRNKRNRKRLSLSSNLEYEIRNKLVVIYRLRYDVTKVNYTGELFTYLRNRFKLEYELSNDLEVNISYEYFYNMSTFDENDVNRIGVSFDYNIIEDIDLETFYKVDLEFESDGFGGRNIFGLMLSYQIR